MSSVAYVGKNAKTLETSPQFDGYSKVVITVSETVEYQSGNNTGRTLALVCPWGTQEMADNILSSIRGFSYQPFISDGALVDPAAELGDGISIGNTYSGIYSHDIKFGSLLSSSVSAPAEEAIDHEYPYIPKQERVVTRQLRQVTSELKVQADMISAEVQERKTDVESLNSKLSIQAGSIEAKVNKTGGESSSFGWALDESSWTIKANGSDVLKATKSGLEVNGIIKATGGQIGGFTIQSNALSFNNQTWGGTNTTGIYIGPQGIQLGKNFKVDSSGNLTAASGTFTGSVRASNIKYGGSNGYMSGAGISVGSLYGGSGGQIASRTITTANTAAGINVSLGYADYANGVFGGWNTAGYVRATWGYFHRISMAGEVFAPVTYTIHDARGVTLNLRVLGQIHG